MINGYYKEQERILDLLLCDDRFLGRYAMAPRQHGVSARTHVLQTAAENMKYGGRTVGVLLCVLALAFSFIRHPVSIPHLLEYSSGSNPGMFVAKATYLSLGTSLLPHFLRGSKGRWFESIPALGCLQ